MLSKQGKIITIEGLDGSGKATQTKLLENKIKDNGIKVRRVSFPDYANPSSALVKMYLNSEFGENPNDVNAYAASSFFAIDRYASYMKSWKDFYLSGEVILADRYISSNIVYQMGKLPYEQWDGFVEWCYDYECEKLGLPNSDVVVYLSVPVNISQELMKKRYHGCEDKKDLHEKNIAFLEKCYLAADYAANKLGWIRIECTQNGLMRTKDEISDDIFNSIKNVVTKSFFSN